jgi:purine-binding chemotaxis protein CheW
MLPKESSNSKRTLDEAFEAAEEKILSFIIFSLGNELYGTPLLSTREVIKVREIKPTPYMVPHFRGVINLRGQIVSVIDLRIKFQISVSNEEPGLILVVETPFGLLGAIVDNLVSVERVRKEDLDQTAVVETRIPTDFFLGVAKLKDRLINMVDISGCVHSEDLRAIAKVS